MVPSGPSVCIAGRMRCLRPFTQHRSGALLLYRMLAHHPPTATSGVCPLRSAVCLAGSHDLYSESSMPTMSGTSARISARLDPLPISFAIARGHMLIQVPRQTYTGTATRLPHDQRPAKRDRRRRDYPCALTPDPLTYT